MLLELGDVHRKHLQIFTSHSGQVVIDFCTLTLEFLQHGYNLKQYSKAAKKLGVSTEQVQDVINGLVYLLIEACKYRLTEEELKKCLDTAEFSQQHQNAFGQFYNAKKEAVSRVLLRLGRILPIYQDLRWRFEVQLATSYSNEIKPSVTMDLVLKILRPPPSVESGEETPEQAPSSSHPKLLKLTAEGEKLTALSSKTANEMTYDIKHIVLQCDLPNLVNMVAILETALLESKTHHVKRMQRAFKKS